MGSRVDPPTDQRGFWDAPPADAVGFWDAFTAGGRPTPLPDGKLFSLGVHESGPQHFNLDEIEAIIGQHGFPCSYRPALRCPCARAETRDAAGDCPLCRPLGFVYPRERWLDTRVLLSGRRQSVTYAAAGLYEQGSIQATLPIAIVPGLMDMIVLSGVPHTVQELRVRARQDVELAHVRARLQDDRIALPALGPAEDRLAYPEIVSLDVVSWVSRDEELIIGRVGIDYVVREGGLLHFLPGRGPTPGSTYTVRYQAQAAYVLPASSTPRAEAGVRLPYRVEAIRLDDAGRLLSGATTETP